MGINLNSIPGAGLAKGLIGGADQVVGHIVGSPGLVQGGQNITNPNVNLLGAANPSQTTGFGPLASGLTSPNHPVQGASTPQPSSAPSYAAAQTGTGTNATDFASLFQPLYDAQIGGLQNQLNALPSYQNADVAQVQNTYNPQATALQQQNTEGGANLDLAQGQLDTSRSEGLRNLGNSLRGALNGYQNQIGVMGAGNSSASPLIGYALSQEGNRQTSDLNTGYDQQQTGLNQQRTNLGASFQNQMDTLNAYKQQSLSQIAEKYSQQQAALQQQIAQTGGEEARYLAMYGSTALAQQAVAQLQGLESQYSDQVGQLNSHFQQVAAPQTDLSQYTNPYQINAVTPDQLAPLTFGANQDTTAAPTATASLLKRPDQTPSTNLGF